MRIRRKKKDRQSPGGADGQKKENVAPHNGRGNGRGKGLGIQWRLLGYLSLFVVLIIAVLWFFQVVLLNRFYETIKEWEMQKTLSALESAVNSEEELRQEVYRCATEYSVCIQVWKINGNRASVLLSADVSNACLIHHVTGDYLGVLYGQAVGAGGSYSTRVCLHTGGMSWVGENGQVFGKKDEIITRDSEDDVVNALYVRVVTGEDDVRYALFLDCELTPMSATVSTLKAQFLLIAALLLVMAALLAWLMSRYISRPLSRMTGEARLLAGGHYEVNFPGGGYRETRELADTLNYAAEELSKTDRLQKELIANISHDLRTPLTMITGYSEVMRDIPGENTPENMQVVIDEANRLSGLVSDLLDLSRIRSGTRAPLREVFDLSEMMRAVLSRYDKLTQHDGYRILADAEGEAWVSADRRMIEQAVYNLVNNAINYCGEDKTVEVSVKTVGGDVRVSVRDHGVGIAPDQIPLIWDRYYKIDRVHRRAMIGTGLGLSIVKNVLEQHDARYGVESRVGEGSDFWFELSTVPAEKGEEGADAEIQPESVQTETESREENGENESSI